MVRQVLLEDPAALALSLEGTPVLTRRRLRRCTTRRNRAIPLHSHRSCLQRGRTRATRSTLAPDHEYMGSTALAVVVGVVLLLVLLPEHMDISKVILRMGLISRGHPQVA